MSVAIRLCFCCDRHQVSRCSSNIMKILTAVAAIVLFIATVISVKEATADKIVVEEGTTTFAIFGYDDGRYKPYKIRFKKDSVVSKFKYNDEGLVKVVIVGSEKYKVVYDSNGNLVKVKVVSSGRRYLLGEETGDIQQLIQRGTIGRRLYDCGECYNTWDVVCSTGHESVCNLASLDTDRLSDAAVEAISTLCD